MKIHLAALAVLTLMGTAASAPAAVLTSELGTKSFNDTDMLTAVEYALAQITEAEVAPFDSTKGFDSVAGPSFSEVFTFDLGGAIIDPILSATIEIGVFDHDSNATGDQVGEFSGIANNLTAALNTAMNASGGSELFSFPPLRLVSEYNTYSVSLLDTADIADDGMASFTLTMQNGRAFPGGTETEFLNNSMGLDYAKLTVVTQDQGGGVIPEPSATVVWSLLSVLGLVSLHRKRRRRLA